MEEGKVWLLRYTTANSLCNLMSGNIGNGQNGTCKYSRVMTRLLESSQRLVYERPLGRQFFLRFTEAVDMNTSAVETLYRSQTPLPNTAVFYFHFIIVTNTFVTSLYGIFRS